MKHRFSCRVCASLLCILVVFTAVLSRPAALNARAASLAGALALDEASMFLWNLLFTAFVGAGAYEAARNDSYEMEAALYQGMVNYYMEQYGAVAVSDDMVFTLQNGSRYTLGDLITAARWDVVGTEGCYIPDEATWQRFKLSAPADESAFSSIAGVSLSADLLEHLAGFAGALAAGEVVGLEAADYFPAGFDGTLPRNADGYYILQGYTAFSENNDYRRYSICSSDLKGSIFSSPVPVVGYLDYRNSHKCVFFGSINDINELFLVNVSCHVVSSAGSNYFFVDDYFFLFNGIYSFNFPVFSSRAAAELFLNTGEFADCENLQLLDYPALADAIPDTLAPLLAKELAPDILLDLYPALMDALNPALNPDIADTKNPALVLDPVAATDAYEKAVAGTVADVVDVAVSVPAVDTDISSYKVNLTNIFPFCLPFDFIHLLEALDAEPVTPCFDFPFVVPALDMDITLQLDLSMFNDFMKIFRLCETMSFIVMLIFITPKLIRW